MQDDSERPWEATERIGRHIDASPTPFHAVARAVGLLEAAGGRAASTVADAAAPGLWYRAAGGALTAWHIAEGDGARTGFRIVGAHTDSPNLRLKPRPDRRRAGYRQVGVEVYGGALLNSWLDRDLGVAGRLAVRADADAGRVRGGGAGEQGAPGDADAEQGAAGGVATCLVRIDEPLLRVAQLAIHLDRDVNERGLVLNRQQHLSPIWGLERTDAPGFVETAAEAAGVAAADVLGCELMAFDLTPARLVGDRRSMMASARIDNLVSCFAAVEALAAVSSTRARQPGGTRIPMACLFDHEEVGSVSAAGAASPLLLNSLDMIAAGFGADSDADPDATAASRADSLVLSADGAHATHPNYVDRHDPEHRIALNGGPVLKWNAGQRYATDAVTGAAFRLACERAGAPLQEFSSRNDLSCGSTIGPIIAGRLGIGVADAGCPQLAMHSARELCGSADVEWFIAAVTEFFAG